MIYIQLYPSILVKVDISKEINRTYRLDDCHATTTINTWVPSLINSLRSVCGLHTYFLGISIAMN